MQDELEFPWDGSAGEQTRLAARRIAVCERRPEPSRYSAFGLCAKCHHFGIITKKKGSYDFHVAWCQANVPSRLDRLSPDLPVINCSLFWPLGAPTLREMFQEAKLLEKRDLLKDYL